jgi:hypothetical protein
MRYTESKKYKISPETRRGPYRAAPTIHSNNHLIILRMSFRLGCAFDFSAYKFAF